MSTIAVAQSYPDLDWSGNSGQRQSSAGSRGCFEGRSKVLIPETSIAGTVASHPTLWVYVPYEEDEFHSIEMVIWNGNTALYETVVPSNGHKAGIISLTVPSDRPALQTGRDYTWQVTVLCDDPNTTGTVDGDYMEGSFRRVSGETTWYDALTAKGQRYCNSGSVTPDWSSLLSMVNYSDIASAPISSCVTLPHRSQS